MFVFGTGPSSSSFDFDSPLGSTSVYRHPKYYMDTDMVVFQVNSCLYRVHKHFFLSEAGFFKDMFALPQYVNGGEAKSKEGTTDDTPIVIPHVTCKEFEALLDFFYYRFSSKEETRSLDQWVSLLSISTRFQLDRIRRRAISEIEGHHPQLHAVDKVVLSVKHSVDPWLIPAYCDICDRTEPLTDQEAEKLGAVTTARLARARELLRKSGRPFPFPVDSVDSKKASRKHTESIVAQILAPSKIVQGLFSTQINSNATISTPSVAFMF
ncbi:hypothetical protein BDM02DRAFT_3106039 [Thelephora ganbajun]|uniref:Uncharacterized protein n=1 Tax=Thelephora ganbajun TaxID=370292 RepID=A0ACB6YYA8_THEGA|nr:hypothetical protein BDM02DRAFT_3106039 [Thelephora ganbajun]